MTMDGSCLCGAVTYQIEGDPAFVGSCYCNECHKESGAGHITVVAVPETAAKVAGITKSHTMPGGSGMEVKRSFCPNCGTTVYGQPAMMPGTMMFRAGTIHQAEQLAPTMAVYVLEALPWDQPPAGMPAFPKMPLPPQ
jgi:hypothetical protein